MSFDPVVKQNGIIDILGLYPNPFTGRPATKLYVRKAVCEDNPDGSVKICSPTKAGWSKYETWKHRYEFLYRLKNHQIILFIDILINPSGEILCNSDIYNILTKIIFFQ